MNHIYVPAIDPGQWAGFLTAPARQWRSGYSAHALAHAWQLADGFPPEVEAVLAASGRFPDVELLLALPEHAVALPGGTRPSQSDVWALARSGEHLVSIAVEGKVSESFGPTVQEWFAGHSPGKVTRLAYLQAELGLEAVPVGTIRYQLLHRAVSAIVEARRFCATQALMLVHSFSPDQVGFCDFMDFVRLLGAEPRINRIVPIGQRGGVELLLGWVTGQSGRRGW
ncbi:DUF6946 family protein [Azohydromonas aeria]|uniref:DUF6946 family protein n=1 Tax=Azohydromonas aeria TaxID=2590212 RepID=UPI0012F97C2B|nr:hypothetical protein [Azohydromonas aeria]